MSLTGWENTAVWLTLCAYLLFVGSCTTTRELTTNPNDTKTMREGRIISVTSKSGNVTTFNKAGGRVVEKSEGPGRNRTTIAGVTDSGRMVELVPDSLVQVKLEQHKANVGGTVAIVVFSTLAVAAGVFITLVVTGLNHN